MKKLKRMKEYIGEQHTNEIVGTVNVQSRFVMVWCFLAVPCGSVRRLIEPHRTYQLRFLRVDLLVVQVGSPENCIRV